MNAWMVRAALIAVMVVGASGRSEAQPGLADVAAENDRSPTAHDPNGDRTLIGPTAFVQPAQTLTVTSHMGLLLGATLGVTDRLTVSGHFAYLEPTSGPDHLASGAAKYALGSLGRFHIAAHGRVAHFADQSETVNTTELGATVSACMSGCQTIVSATASGLRFTQTSRFYGSGLSSLALVGNLSVVTSIGRRVKVYGEVSTSTYIEDNDIGATPVIGLRLHHRQWVVEVAAISGVGYKFGEFGGFEAGLFPLPWLSAAYRFGI